MVYAALSELKGSNKIFLEMHIHCEAEINKGNALVNEFALNLNWLIYLELQRNYGTIVEFYH